MKGWPIVKWWMIAVVSVTILPLAGCSPRRSQVEDNAARPTGSEKVETMTGAPSAEPSDKSTPGRALADLTWMVWKDADRNAAASTLPIELTPAVTARMNEREGKLVLNLDVKNGSKTAVKTLAGHEWHGGIWPPTDLYALVSSGQPVKPGMFHPVYLVGERQEIIEPTTIKSGETVSFPIRMDWTGTGSRGAQPLMSPAAGAEYKVTFLLVFEANGVRQYVLSQETAVRAEFAKKTEPSIPRELLESYSGDVQLPDDLYNAYAAFVRALDTADEGSIQKHCLPQSVTFTTSNRPDQTREYGQDINIPFLKEGFQKNILSLRKDSENTYLIRTGSSYMWFVRTQSEGWKLYRYGDKPIM